MTFLVIYIIGSLMALIMMFLYHRSAYKRKCYSYTFSVADLFCVIGSMILSWVGVIIVGTYSEDVTLWTRKK